MEPVSRKRRRGGRLLSGISALFLAFDATGKLLELQPVVEGSVALGYPADSVVPIGLLLLVGVVLYLLPRTAAIGAIYLSAYLGGAVATHLRVGDPLLTHTLFPTYVAALLWGGLVLRRPRLLPALLGDPSAAPPAGDAHAAARPDAVPRAAAGGQ